MKKMTKEPPLASGLRYMRNRDGSRTCLGALMGRKDNPPEPEDEDEPWPKFRLFRMNMIDRNYDRGGAYWGSGDHKVGFMYRACDPDGVWNIFVRARTREEARDLLYKKYPKIRFFL